MSKRTFMLSIALGVCVLLSPWLATARAAPRHTVGADAADISAETLQSIEALIEKYTRDGNIPGAAVVIVHNDQTVFSKGFGYADIASRRPVSAETLFELGSTSKAFTALGALRLEAQGLIRLDAPV